MVLKAFNVDGSSKMIAVHGGMSAREVCFMLADRNHQDLGPNWTIVEKLTDLHLGKYYMEMTLTVTSPFLLLILLLLLLLLLLPLLRAYTGGS